MSEQYNNLPPGNINQIFLQKQSSAPRWLRFIFKAWAIMGFLTLGTQFILITFNMTRLINVLERELGDWKKFFIFLGPESYWLLFLYPGLISLLLVFSIPFWGVFKLRKWVLPMIFLWALFSAIQFFAVLFHQPIQFSAKIFFSVAIIVLAIFAFFFRNVFSGSYRKLSLQIIFFLIAIPSFAIGSLSLLFPDLPEIQDSDLTNLKITLPPEEQNVYYLFAKIIEEVNEPIEESNKQYAEFLEGKSWNQKEVDLILNKNEKILSEMRRAAKFSFYQCPSAVNLSADADLCILNFKKVKASAQIAALSALSRANNNDFQGAIEDALLPVRLGQILMEEPYITMLDYLIGDAMRNIGFKTLQIIMSKYDISSETLLPRIMEFEKYLENEQGLKNVFQQEYIILRNSFDFLLKFSKDRDFQFFYIQPNRFFSEMAENTKQKMALAEIPCHRLEDALKEYRKDFEKHISKIAIWKLPFTRNAVLEALKRVVITDSVGASIRCKADLLVEQIRLQMALKAYKFENGRYPESQLELVPKYLRRPIINPFTNTVFDYNKTTGEIVLPPE